MYALVLDCQRAIHETGNAPIVMRKTIIITTVTVTGITVSTVVTPANAGFSDTTRTQKIRPHTVCLGEL